MNFFAFLEILFDIVSKGGIIIFDDAMSEEDLKYPF